MKYKTARPVRSGMLVFGSPMVTQREIEAVEAVMRSCWLGTGPRVSEFEQAFASYVGAPHAVALNSCTAALHLAMVASGLGAGDEVITTPMTFCATANAIVHTGATPVFVDVKRDTMNIDADLIEAAITEKTRAILPVHFAGRPCAMDAITELARAHGLLVIEDAAHAIEACYHGAKVGSIGDMTCFSFYVTKNIFTGEGGMVTCRNGELAERIKIYGLHGMTQDAWSRYSDEGFKHYQVIHPGYKYNMMDIQAAIGCVQMPLVERHLERRREIWRRYDEAFAALPLDVPDAEEPDTVHARHLYTILLQLEKLRCTRDEFMEGLCAEKIGTGVHYISLHLHPYYRGRFGFTPGGFPVAADISQRTLSLPLSPKLTDRDVEDVVTAVKRVAEFYAA